MPEVLDMTVVTCDGRTALVDFEVWSARLNKSVVVRAGYEAGKRLSILPEGGLVEDEEVIVDVLLSEECLADVDEAVQDQRDCNGELS